MLANKEMEPVTDDKRVHSSCSEDVAVEECGKRTKTMHATIEFRLACGPCGHFLRLCTGVDWHHRHLISERKYPEIYNVYFTGSYSLDYSAVRHSSLHYLLLLLLR